MRKWSLLPILLCLCLLAGCAAGPEKRDEGYEEVFHRYMEALNARSLEEMYGLLTPESRERVSLERYVERHKNIYSGIDSKAISASITGITNLDRSGRPDSVGARSIAYDMRMDSLAGEIAFSNAVAVYAYRRDGAVEFLIDWNEGVILPQLNEERPVRVYRTEAKRGSVYDREGRMMAGDGVIKAIGLVRGKMGEDRDQEVLRIAELLQMPVAVIEDKLNADWVTDDILVPIAELTEADRPVIDELLKIPGIRVDDKAGRVYPYGKEAAQEEQHKQTLRGEDGVQIVITDARGEVITVLKERPVRDGQDVHLDVDAEAL